MMSLLVLFFITLVIAILSGLLFLIHKVPLRYAKYHLIIFSVSYIYCFNWGRFLFEKI